MIGTPIGQSLLRPVDELISYVTMESDEVLLNDILHYLDVARILRIPLSMNMDEDFVAWHFTKSHTFPSNHPITRTWA
jgi:hypothetical protein